MRIGRRLVAAARMALAFCLLLTASRGLMAEQPCAFKSGNKVTTDRPYYAPTETVKITGSGFDKSCTVTLSVIRPDGTSKGDQASSTDKNGGFSNTYVVPALKGTYTIQALGSSRALLASATFRVLDWTVSTDRADYNPGDTVTMTGSGWRVGETIKLLVHEVKGQVPDRTFSAKVDANGNFVNTDLVMNPNDDGRKFLLTATGQSSGLTAQTAFTDGTKTWTGAVSTAWFDSGNWQPQIPASGDSASIPGSLTNYPVITSNVSIATVNLNSSGTGATLTVASGGTFTESGPLLVNASGTVSVTGGTFKMNNVVFTFNGSLNVSGGTFDATGFDISPGSGNLTVSGSGALLAKNVNNIGSMTISTSSTVTLNDLGPGFVTTMSSGTLKIAHDMRPASFSATGGTVEFTGSSSTASFPTGYQFFDVLIDAAVSPGFDNFASTQTVLGNWTNNSAVTSLTLLATTVSFAGSSAQTIGGSAATTFRNLTINNSAGVSLSGIGATVGTASASTGTLTFTSGNITTGSNTVIIAAGGSVSRTSGHVVGNLRKQISANGTVSKTYEIGTGSNYTPVDVTFTSVGSSNTDGTTYLTASTTAGDHPNISTSGLNVLRTANRYWTLIKGGGWTFTSYSATFTFVAGDLDAAADTANFIVKRYSAGWNSTATGTQTSTSTQATGLTAFGDFAVGNPTAATKLAITSVNGGSNPTAGSGFSVVVQSQDDSGNPFNVVANTGISLSLKTGTGTLGGSLTGTITAGTSSVTITGVTYTKAESGVVITATRTSGDSLTPGDSAPFTVNPGAATQLAFGTQPSNTTAAQSISPAVTVRILDSNGNLTTSTASVTVAIGTNPGSGTLSGTLTVAAVSGVATFSNLSINKSGTGYTLTAASSGLTGATSNTFNITAGSASKVNFGTQPSNTTAAQSISPAVTVRIEDTNGNLTTSTASVTVAIGTNPSSGTLSGTLTVAAVAGVATFSNLSIDKAGTGYTLTAASSGLTGATSNTFDITAGSATKLNFGTQPSNTTAAQSISPAVTVRIEDANGNLTTSTASVTVAIGTNPGSGTLSGTLTVAAVAGVATFSNLSINKVGTGYTLTAASSGLTGATSGTFNITAGALDHLVLSPASDTISAGGSKTYTADGRDQFDNSLGDVTSQTTFTIGPDGSCTVATCTATVSGAHTVTGTDSGKTGTASLTVTAAAAHHFVVTAPANASTGNPVTVTVTAQDQYNNTATAYTGTAHFTSSDGAAVLPGNYAFQAADNGSHTFTGGVTLNTAGTKTVTATDTVTSSITGSATVSVTSSITSSDLAVTVTDGVTRASSCSTVTYTIVVTNNGPDAVTGATATDSFPAQLTGVTWTCSASAGSSCGAASGSGNISTTANLLNGGTATYTATGTVAQTTDGTISNTASAAVPAGAADPSSANNSAADTDSLNYWVNNATGSDANAGTFSAPFATIAKAASVIGGSATVYVQVGNSQSGTPYAANVTIAGTGQNGTASCPTVFYGLADGSGHLPLMRGTDPTADLGFDVSSNHVQIDGFEIANTLVALVAEPDTSAVVFSNNHVQVPDLAYGILLYSSSGSLAKSNMVDASGNNSFFGIWDYSGTGDTLDGNKVSGQAGAGLRSDFSTGLILQRNIVKGNYIGVQMSNASGTANLYNNTVDANAYLGLYAESPGGTVTSRNNIVINSGVGWAWNGSGTISSDYDNVYGNTSNYSYHGTVSAGAHSMSDNPGFLQTADPTLPTYFRLTSGSPCIDNGVNVGLPFQGSAPDMGAVETQ